jgi:hypothetical protein
MFYVMHTVLLPKELISVLAIYMGILNMSMKVSNIESFLYMCIGYVRELMRLSSPRGLAVI